MCLNQSVKERVFVFFLLSFRLRLLLLLLSPLVSFILFISYWVYFGEGPWGERRRGTSLERTKMKRFSWQPPQRKKAFSKRIFSTSSYWLSLSSLLFLVERNDLHSTRPNLPSPPLPQCLLTPLSLLPLALFRLKKRRMSWRGPKVLLFSPQNSSRVALLTFSPKGPFGVVEVIDDKEILFLKVFLLFLLFFVLFLFLFFLFCFSNCLTNSQLYNRISQGSVWLEGCGTSCRPIFSRPIGCSLWEFWHVRGLGTGAVLKFLFQQNKNLLIDVVEIDKHVVNFAKKYFDFRTTGKVYVQDGRKYLFNTKSIVSLLALFVLFALPSQWILVQTSHRNIRSGHHRRVHWDKRWKPFHSRGDSTNKSDPLSWGSFLFETSRISCQR